MPLRVASTDGLGLRLTAAHMTRMDRPPGGILTEDGGVFSEKLGSLFRVQISASTVSLRHFASSTSGTGVSGSALWAILFLAATHAEKNLEGVMPQISAGAVIRLPRRARADGNDSSQSEASTLLSDLASTSVNGWASSVASIDRSA